MRGVVVFLTALAVSACATVSVVPSETVLSEQVTERQSALREASDAFRDHALDHGWVSEGAGFRSMANLLINGAPLSADQAPAYADLIEAASGAPSTIFDRVIVDAQMARSYLAAANAEAEDFLVDRDTKAARADVFAFERALVEAQKTRRAFADAIDLAASRADGAAIEVEAALSAFDAEIDRTRKIADRLADRYAGRITTAS